MKSPADSTEDREVMIRSFEFSVAVLIRDLCDIDLLSVGSDFEVPVLCLGSYNQETPIELAERYFATINTPRKAFVCFEGCHHFVHRPVPGRRTCRRHVLHPFGYLNVTLGMRGRSQVKLKSNVELVEKQYFVCTPCSARASDFLSLFFWQEQPPWLKTGRSLSSLRLTILFIASRS